MNRTLKVLMTLTALALVLGLAVGCPSKETPAPTKPAEGKPTEEKPAEVLELDIFHFYGEGAGVQPELVIQGQKFEEENPQYKIKWTWGGSEANNLLRARINADDPPDVAINNDANITIHARSGLALPLDEYLEGQNYEGTAKWKDTFWPGVLANAFIEDAQRGAHYYGIPWETHISGIYYNVGLFEENDYAIPGTWDEMIALCDTIQEDQGIACFCADNSTHYNARELYYAIGRNCGFQKLYDTAMNKPGTTWQDPCFIEAAGMAQTLRTEYTCEGWEGNKWPTGQVDFANWGAAMIFMPTWLPSEVREAMAEDFVLNIFPVPAIEGAEGDADIAEMKYNGWFIPEDAKNPDEAMHFIKFLTSEYAQKMNMDEGGLPPAIQGIGFPPGVEGAATMLEGFGSVRFGVGLDADALEWQQKVMFPLVSELQAGRITPEEFADQVQVEHDKYYEAQPVEEAVAKPEAPPPAELDIFHFYGEGAGIQPELVLQGQKFEEDNPGFTIKWTWGGSEANNLLRARINAGDPPDVAINNDANVTIHARSGLALPLDEYLESPNYEGTAKWKDTFWPGVLANAFIEDAQRGAHYYGIPWETHISGIYYNVGLFEENDYAIPGTWDEMIALCDTIQEDQGIACFCADNSTHYNARELYYAIGRNCGFQKLYDTAMNKPGTTWQDPCFIEAAGMAQTLRTEYTCEGWEGNKWPTGQVDFANWGAAMIFMPTWLPSEVREAMAEDFVLNIFPVPAIEGAEGDADIAEMKYNGWFIPEDAKNPDEAMHFIKFLTSEYAQKMNMDEGGLPPAIQGIGFPPGVEGAATMLEGFGSVRFGVGLDADALEWQQKVMFPLVSELQAGRITPEEFADQVQVEHDKYYAQ